MNEIDNFSALLLTAAEKGQLKKTVFSKSTDTHILRAVATVRMVRGQNHLQIEYFTKDNKALHRNLPLTSASFAVDFAEVANAFRQINLIAFCGECEYRRSKSGNETILGEAQLRNALTKANAASEETTPVGNNRMKDYILKGNEPFLKLLGISDENGRIHDKKQAKFRQINRFLEHIRDVLKYLPKEEICICDLCCGKSYLSFVVYHYFANTLGYRVRMTGIDLKADVIAYCSDTAKALGFDGLSFICQDILQYETDALPDLVISLHACDTATDVVLEKAVAWQTPVILSTPCCHHELNKKLCCPSLSFIADYSMLRQKFCDAATDAMRLKMLEAHGYTTDALELIDPEDTPKNILLRGIRKKNPSAETLARAQALYQDIRQFLMGKENPQ